MMPLSHGLEQVSTPVPHLFLLCLLEFLVRLNSLFPFSSFGLELIDSISGILVLIFMS